MRITITTTAPLLFFLCLYLVTSISSEAVRELGQQKEEQTMRMPGSYAAIPNSEDDERVQSVAQFAVDEARSVMSFAFTAELASVRPIVVRGYRQVVAGLNYKLVIVLVKNVDSDDTPTTTTPELQDIVGGFGVTVYDHFGELSVTKWGKELSREQAIALLENTHEFGEDETNPFDE